MTETEKANRGVVSPAQNASCRLEDLTPGAQVRGVVPREPVSVVAVRWHGSIEVALTFQLACVGC
jgi:hypothetical protein